MRRVPGLRRIVVAQALAVRMAHHRRSLVALRPVVASAILAGRERGAIRLGASQDVVHVRRVAAAIDDLTLLGQRRLLGEVVLAVKLGHVLRDDDTLGVLPGARPDAVFRVDRAASLSAQVRMPGLAARTRRLRERLAELVGTGEATEVGALSGAGAGDEEAHIALPAGGPAEPEQGDRDKNRQTQPTVHFRPPLSTLIDGMGDACAVTPESEGRRTPA